MKSVKGYGPPCPHCGDIKSTRIKNGWSEPHDNYLRYKSCANCGEKFTTVEVTVPPDDTTFYRLDYVNRAYRREMWRRIHGKTGKWQAIYRKPDQLFVTLKVQASHRVNTECINGHPYTPENTKYSASDGFRRCQTCRRLNNHSNYLKRKSVA